MIDRHDHLLRVERLQILRRAAAASDDQDIAPVCLCRCDSAANRLYRRIALHLCRIHQQMSHRIPAADDVPHVLQCRTDIGCNDADSLGHDRNGTLGSYIKNALICQLFLQLFQRSRLHTCAVRLHVRDVQLEAALFLIEHR